MAVALVQQNTAVVTPASTSHSVSYDTATTAGNFLLVMIATSGGSTANITGASGGSGNTWVELADLGASSASNTQVAIYYCVNAAATTTVTLTSGSLTSQLIALEISGVDPTTPINASQIAADQSAATSHTSPSITPTVDGCFVVGFINHSGANNPTLSGATYTALETPATNGSIHGRGAYRIATTATAESVTWTGTTSVRAVTATVALAPAADAGGATTPPPPLWIVNQAALVRANYW